MVGILLTHKSLDDIALSKRPVCGVVATALVTGKSFTETWNHYKATKKSPRWTGWLYEREIIKSLEQFNVPYEKIELKKWHKKPLLNTVVNLELMDDTNLYMVFTRKHVQLVQVGRVVDQGGCVRVHNYWARNRRVKSMYRIDNHLTKQFDAVHAITNMAKGYWEDTGLIEKEIKECMVMSEKETKFSKAEKIVDRMAGSKRKEVISQIVSELETSWGSASMFYHRVLRGKKKSEPVTQE